jgi:sugar phosphate isomerase/epimerase
VGELAPLVEDLRRESGNAGILLDLFHAHAAGERIEDLVRQGPVIWVHAADVGMAGVPTSDEQRTWPAPEGGAGLADAFRTLALAGYAGPVTLETFRPSVAFARGNPDDTAARAACALGSVRPRNAPGWLVRP